MTKTMDFFHLEGEGEEQVATLLPVTFGTLMSPFALLLYSTNQHQSPVGGFNRADRHSLFYTSDIHNFEVNGRIRPRGRADRLVLHPNGKWRRECQPGGYLSYVFGFRVMSMNERFDFHSEGQIDITNYDPVTQSAVFYGSTPVSGDYRIRTHNDLVGLQIGGDWIYRQCKWAWGIRAKAGPFINFEDMSSHLAINATPAVWDTEAGMFVSVGDPYLPADAQDLDIRRTAKRNGAALVGEVGVVGTYKVNPHLTLRAAYDIVWVTGLALAPEQLVYETDPPEKLKVNDNGHYFLQGITLGGEFLW